MAVAAINSNLCRVVMDEKVEVSQPFPVKKRKIKRVDLVDERIKCSNNKCKYF